GLVEQTLELVDGLHRRVVDGDDHIARPDAGTFGGARNFLHDQAVVEVAAAHFVRGKRPHGNAELALTRAFLVTGAGDLFALEVAERRGQLLGAAVAPDFERDLRASLERRDHRGQIARARDFRAVELEDHVTRLEPRLRTGASLFDLGNERALWRLEPEVLRQRLVDLLDRDAQLAVARVTRLHDLVLDMHRHVDRHRERQALEAAAAAADLRIHTDNFTLEIEQRAAGIPGVDRRIGLDERDVGITRQRARLGADDARGHSIFETERLADRHDPLANLGRFRVADLDVGQILR